MVYIGIDPSYTRTGVTYVDPETKNIVFVAVSPKGTNQTYSDAVLRAQYISETILLYFPDHNKTVMLEEPLITSQMSSRLGILSGVIATTLRHSNKITDIYTINPNAVSNTNRRVKGYTSKTRKSVSREQCLKYLEVFESFGYTTTIYSDKFNKDGSMKKRVLSTDEAESFIMSILLMRHLQVLPQELVKKLIEVNRGLNTEITINKIGENK